jgi:hypothetical protein
VTLLWLALHLAPDALAGDPAALAEQVRLTEEMHGLAARHAWAGVERLYEELEARGVVFGYDDLLAGAQAARSAGRMGVARERLLAAARIRGTREVVDWLAAIDASYGAVVLVGLRRTAAALVVEDAPFDPDQRAALDAARAELAATGSFDGLLPRGSYRFADQAFTVEPGIAVRIEVDARARRDDTPRKTP